jgi:hypothetical protein
LSGCLCLGPVNVDSCPRTGRGDRARWHNTRVCGTGPVCLESVLGLEGVTQGVQTEGWLKSPGRIAGTNSWDYWSLPTTLGQHSDGMNS